MQMVFRKSGRRTVRSRPNAGERLTGDEGKALDRAPRIEIRVADSVNVRGCPPGMEARVAGQGVRRRAVTAVGGDVDEAANRFTETFQADGEKGDGAGD